MLKIQTKSETGLHDEEGDWARTNKNLSIKWLTRWYGGHYAAKWNVAVC